mgnify:CR=1 FL=1
MVSRVGSVQMRNNTVAQTARLTPAAVKPKSGLVSRLASIFKKPIKAVTPVKKGGNVGKTMGKYTSWVGTSGFGSSNNC